MEKKKPIRRAVSAFTAPYRRAFNGAIEPHRKLMKQMSRMGRGALGDWKRISDKNLRKEGKAKALKMERDFEVVKQVWGFEDEQIPEICRNIRIETILYGTIGAAGALLTGAGYDRSFEYLLSGIALCVIGGVLATFNVWRISVIRNRTYRPFRLWLLGRVGEDSDR